MRLGCGDWIRTSDLLVMSQADSYFPTPQFNFKRTASGLQEKIANVLRDKPLQSPVEDVLPAAEDVIV